MRVQNCDDTMAALGCVYAKHPEIKLALIYGSASRDEMREDSDVDVAVSTGHRMSWDDRIALLLEFQDAVHREVDLIDLEALEGLLWEFLWSDAKFVVWDHDLVVRYAGKTQAFVEDVKPGYMAMVDERLLKALGPV